MCEVGGVAVGPVSGVHWVTGEVAVGKVSGVHWVTGGAVVGPVSGVHWVTGGAAVGPVSRVHWVTGGCVRLEGRLRACCYTALPGCTRPNSCYSTKSDSFICTQVCLN